MAIQYQDALFDDNIAAIDFGTTFCSLGYKVKGKNIESLKINDMADRVPNVVLIKKVGPNIEVDEIGFVAQDKYKNIRMSKYKEYLYFECFKMQLRDEKILTRQMLISAFVGADYYIIEVIALILQYLRMKFEEHLSMATHRIKDGASLRVLKATDFHWVLTVPAIWKDRGKQMMREAAYRAGLLCDVPLIEKLTIPPKSLSIPDIPHLANEKLVLALEPECAALYCQQLTKDMLAAHCDSNITANSKQYMILDIGGGTVDIAIHDLVADKTINSVLPPTGNDWGGTKVNNEFSLLLQNITGDKGFKHFCSIPGKEAAHKAVVTNLVFQDFEQPKKLFGDRANKDSFTNIRLDAKLLSVYKAKFTEMSEKYGIEFEDEETIIISSSKMKELFQPAISGIVSCMNLAMDKSSVSIDTIYLVGGFGGCPYIFTKVKEALAQKKVNVVVPANYKLAVALGAVIFRQRMSAVNSRMSDAYYGVRITDTYDEKIHPVERRVKNEDGDYEVRYVFSIFVKKGQSVKFNEMFKKSLFPSFSAQTSVTMAIYRTTIDGVVFVKDLKGNPIPEIEELGEVILPVPINDLKLSERKIKLEVTFGGTELQVKAKYGPTGDEVDAKLNFLK